RDDLGRAVPARERLGDQPEPRDDRERVHPVAGRLPLRHREAIPALPGADRLDRDSRGGRQGANGEEAVGNGLGLCRGPGGHGIAFARGTVRDGSCPTSLAAGTARPTGAAPGWAGPRGAAPGPAPSVTYAVAPQRRWMPFHVSAW